MILRSKTVFLYLILTMLSVSALFAADFGAVLNAAPEFDSSLEPEFAFTGTITPWVSAMFNPRLTLYASAVLTMEYRNKELRKPLLAELDRTEVSWRPASALFLQFGRQHFADSASLVAAGLFDGFNGSWSLGRVRLSLGAFYTGLQYKERAKIRMTDADKALYGKELDYHDMDSYFASRRILIPLAVEFPGLTERSSLVLNGIAQFDVNGNEGGGNTLHSQYLEAQYFIKPLEPLSLSIAALGSLVEAETIMAGFAAAAEADWELPTTLQDMLSLQVRWSNGRVSDKVAAYQPISGISVGEVFTPYLSALMFTRLAYIARPHKTFSFEGAFSYFIRTDLKTLEDVDIDMASNSRLLGGELYGSLVWAPQAEFRITAGGGAFFPGMGGAFNEDADIRWKAKLALLVSL
jgi:hypothetical protein